MISRRRRCQNDYTYFSNILKPRMIPAFLFPFLFYKILIYEIRFTRYSSTVIFFLQILAWLPLLFYIIILNNYCWLNCYLKRNRHQYRCFLLSTNLFRDRNIIKINYTKIRKIFIIFNISDLFKFWFFQWKCVTIEV